MQILFCNKSLLSYFICEVITFVSQLYSTISQSQERTKKWKKMFSVVGHIIDCNISQRCIQIIISEFCLSVCLFFRLFVHLKNICLSVCPYIKYLSVCSSTKEYCLPLCLSVCLSTFYVRVPQAPISASLSILLVKNFSGFRFITKTS